jgi:hypothetical protein
MLASVGVTVREAGSPRRCWSKRLLESSADAANLIFALNRFADMLHDPHRAANVLRGPYCCFLLLFI